MLRIGQHPFQYYDVHNNFVHVHVSVNANDAWIWP